VGTVGPKFISQGINQPTFSIKPKTPGGWGSFNERLLLEPFFGFHNTFSTHGFWWASHYKRVHFLFTWWGPILDEKHTSFWSPFGNSFPKGVFYSPIVRGPPFLGLKNLLWGGQAKGPTQGGFFGRVFLFRAPLFLFCPRGPFLRGSTFCGHHGGRLPFFTFEGAPGPFCRGPSSLQRGRARAGGLRVWEPPLYYGGDRPTPRVLWFPPPSRLLGVFPPPPHFWDAAPIGPPFVVLTSARLDSLHDGGMRPLTLW